MTTKITIKFDLERQRHTAFGPTFRRELVYVPELRLVRIDDVHRDCRGRSFAVHHGRHLSCMCEGWTKAAITSFIKRNEDAFNAIADGYSERFDGNNNVGDLTEAAQDTWFKIAADLMMPCYTTKGA